MIDTIIIVVVAFSVLSIFLARRGGMGELGRRIRNSDYWALQDAIIEREEKIKELEKKLLETKTLWRRRELLDYIHDEKVELEQLISLKPKYQLEEKF